MKGNQKGYGDFIIMGSAEDHIINAGENNSKAEQGTNSENGKAAKQKVHAEKDDTVNQKATVKKDKSVHIDTKALDDGQNPCAKKSSEKQLHEGHRIRLRKRLLNLHVSEWEQHEMIELLLYAFFCRGDTNGFAHRLLEHFGSVEAVIKADVLEIEKIGCFSSTTAQQICLFGKIVQFLAWRRRNSVKYISSYDEVRKLIAIEVEECDSESLFVVLMDANRKILCKRIIEGCSPACARITFRPIAELCLRYSPVSIAVSHIHPSGFAMPSKEDDAFTEELMIFLNNIDITLFDHFIWATDKLYSYSTSGRLDAIRKKIYDRLKEM